MHGFHPSLPHTNVWPAVADDRIVVDVSIGGDVGPRHMSELLHMRVVGTGTGMIGLQRVSQATVLHVHTRQLPFISCNVQVWLTQMFQSISTS